MILLCFLTSACGAATKFFKGSVLDSEPLSESGFKAAVTPVPSEGISRNPAMQAGAFSEDPLPSIKEPSSTDEAWFVFDEAGVFASLENSGEAFSLPATAPIPIRAPNQDLAAENGRGTPFSEEAGSSFRKIPPTFARYDGFETPPEQIIPQEREEALVAGELPSGPFPLEKEPFFPSPEPPETYARFLEASSPAHESSPNSEEEPGPEAVCAVSQTFPSVVNERVQDFISFFQGRAGSFFSRSLARSQAYEEMMKKIFREKNLPEELFYLALIESGYNPTALSRAKASGIWQFISQTAKRFGLRVDKWVDERRDPEKSTLAAAEYLKILYEMFNCWDLAAAGYNAGEGRILGAMKKARSDDFWEISKYRYLKQETRQYVPMFLAAMTIAREPEKYGFSDIPYHPPLVYEKVAVPPYTSLALVARAAETDLFEIQALNPSILKGKTPPNSPQFEVNIPPGKKETFEKNFPALAKAFAVRTTHRLRSGETLSHLARKYKVGIEDLCRVNGLSPKTVLKTGDIIKIPH